MITEQCRNEREKKGQSIYIPLIVTVNNMYSFKLQSCFSSSFFYFPSFSFLSIGEQLRLNNLCHFISVRILYHFLLIYSRYVLRVEDCVCINTILKYFHSSKMYNFILLLLPSQLLFPPFATQHSSSILYLRTSSNSKRTQKL